MELTEEEREFVLLKRKHAGVRKLKSVPGIGTGVPYFKARIRGRQFIDEATYIEQEGSHAGN